MKFRVRCVLVCVSVQRVAFGVKGLGLKAGLCITTDGLTMTPRPLHMRKGAARDPACGGTSIAHWPRMGFSCPQTLVTKPSAVEDGSALHVK